MSAVAETAVIERLKDVSGVTDLVGERIYPRIAPQGADKPYLIVMRPEGQTNQRVSGGLLGVSFTPIVVACVGVSYIESRSLSGPVVTALDPPSQVGSMTWGTTEVAACQLDDTFDSSTMPQLADEIGFPVEFVAFNMNHAS